jgi:hypothetical protein
VVYDTIKKIWVSIDNYNIGAIKQFGATKSQFDPTLYCITATTVYTMEAGAYLPSTIYTRAISPEDAAMEIKLNDAYAIFDESPSDDTVVVTEYSNNIRGAVTSIPITSSFGGISYPVTYASGFDAEDSLKHLRFSFQGRSRLGFKSSAIVQWSNGAKLIHWQPQYETDSTGVSLKQIASILNTM